MIVGMAILMINISITYSKGAVSTIRSAYHLLIVVLMEIEWMLINWEIQELVLLLF
ncbi:hypothetical protein D3C72_1985260 [compost metagenome]